MSSSNNINKSYYKLIIVSTRDLIIGNRKKGHKNDESALNKWKTKILEGKI